MAWVYIFIHKISVVEDRARQKPKANMCSSEVTAQMCFSMHNLTFMFLN